MPQPHELPPDLLARGYAGSLRMGVEHAVFCLGCCWLLFLILFPLGMMNIAILAVITALILAEKTSSLGKQVALAGGLALIVYGAVVVGMPDALPMTMGDSQAMEMQMSGEQMPQSHVMPQSDMMPSSDVMPPSDMMPAR